LDSLIDVIPILMFPVCCMLVWDCRDSMCSHQANNFHVLQLLTFYCILSFNNNHMNILIY